MNQFEVEIKRRLKKYHAQLAELENAFYHHEIADKDYVVEYEKIKAALQRIAELKLLIKYWSKK